MDFNNKDDKKQLVIALILITCLGIIGVLLGISGRFASLCETIWEIFKSRESLRIYVESWGSWAPIAFISIQAIQVVIAPIPGELTGVVGGFIFGALPNLVYSSIGLTVGSVVAFLAARIVGLPIVKLVVSRKLLDKFHFLTERRGTFVTLILFTIPGFPKDILSYMLGLSPMGFVKFVLVCTLGRIPGTVMLSFGGEAVFEENWALLAIVSFVCLAALVAFFFSRDRIELWLKTRSG